MVFYYGSLNWALITQGTQFVLPVAFAALALTILMAVRR